MRGGGALRETGGHSTPGLRSTFWFIVQFEATGMRVLTAESGAPAVKMCHEQEVDRVLMDLHMPGLDCVLRFDLEEARGIALMLLNTPAA